MRRVLIAAAVLTPSMAHAQESGDSVCALAGWEAARGARPASAVVIDRAELERRGWTRVSEALQATTWSLSSIEGYTFDASPDGLPSARYAGDGLSDWIVLVDGQQVPVRAARTRLLELLPVTTSQIERITIVRSPMVAAGRLASRGVIHIETQRTTGPRFRGGYTIGNERGDPGPYRYTDDASPNVERLGPDAMGAVFVGSERADVQASARYSSLNVTDEALLPRLHPDIGPSGRNLWQQVVGVSGRAGLRAGCRGRHDLVAGHSRFTGVLYQPTRDDWTQTSLTHGGLSGYHVAGGTALRYAVHASRLSIDTLPPDPSPSLPRTSDAVGLDVHASRAVRRITLDVDGSASRTTLDADGPASSRTDGSLLLGVGARRGPAWSDVAVGVARAYGVTGAQLLALVGLDRGHSAMRVHAGYDGAALGRDASSDSPDLSAGTPSLAWIGAAWQRAARGMRVELGADVRRAAGWHVRAIDRDVVGDLTTVGVETELAYAIEDATASLRYRLDAPTSGESALDETLAATPRHQLRASASTARLPGNFRLSAFATVRSATRWPPLVSDSGAAELSSLVRLDATVEKWFWRDRLRVYAAGRNLLDREERWHPAGAHFALRVHIGADLELR